MWMRCATGEILCKYQLCRCSCCIGYPKSVQSNALMLMGLPEHIHRAFRTHAMTSVIAMIHCVYTSSEVRLRRWVGRWEEWLPVAVRSYGYRYQTPLSTTPMLNPFTIAAIVFKNLSHFPHISTMPPSFEDRSSGINFISPWLCVHIFTLMAV